MRALPDAFGFELRLGPLGLLLLDLELDVVSALQDVRKATVEEVSCNNDEEEERKKEDFHGISLLQCSFEH